MSMLSGIAEATAESQTMERLIRSVKAIHDCAEKQNLSAEAMCEDGFG